MSDMDTSGAKRRYKRWPEALKREVVAATLVPGASVSVVAPGLREDQRVSPAPFTSPRAAGPDPISSPLLFEKFGQERYAREGVPLSLSTLADQVGAGCAVPEPLLRRIERHVLGAERLHGDDTTVPVLACWIADIEASAGSQG